MAPPEKNSTPDPKTPPGTKRVERSAARRWLRAVGRLAGRLALMLAGLVIVLVLVVQTRWGSQQVGEALIALADPFEGATIEAGRIGGNWITTLEVHDLNVIRADSVRMIHVDTLRVRHQLLRLFLMTYHARSAYVAGPVIAMEQQADTTWDLLNVLPTDTTTADAEPGSFTIQVDQLNVRDGRLDVRFFAPGRDATLRAEAMHTRGGLTLGKTTAFRLDTLWTALKLPGQTEPLHLQTRIQLADGRLTLVALRLDGPGSTVKAHGHLRLPDDAHAAIYDVDVALHAAPLALRDFYPFFPNPDASETADVDVHVQGTGDLLQVGAEARLSDGARLTLEAEATPTTEGALTYRLRNGTIRGLDPSLFTGDPAMAGRVNADLRGDLNGTALDSLNGTLHAEVFDTRYGAYAFDPTTLQATFTDGNATVTLRTGLRDATLSINGAIRPLDTTPTYDFRGRFDDLDLGRFAEGQASDLHGSFRLAGRGFDLAQAGLSARLVLDASRINRYRLQTGTLTATLDDGTLDLDARLRFPEGILQARGTVVLDDEIRYEIRTGRFEQFDLAAFLGDTTRSALNGTFALRGRGTDPATMTFDKIRLAVSDSFYGPYLINTADAQGTLQDGTLRLNTQAHLDGGTFNLEALLRPFDATPSFAVTRGDFQRVDVGRLTQTPNQQSNLNGTLTLRGQGFDPASMTLDLATVSLDSSSYNDQMLDAARLDATLRQGRLDFTASMQTPKGTTTFAGSTTPFADDFSFTLREGSLNRLNLSTLLNVPYLDTDLNGSFQRLDVQGAEPQTMTLQAALTLDTSRINQETITSGTAQIDLRDGLLRAQARLDLALGHIRLDTLQGRLFDERPTYAASGSVQNVDLARLSGLDTLQLRLTAQFDVAGEGLDPETMRLTQGRLDARNARYHDITIRSLQAGLRLDNGLLHVDTLDIRSNVARVKGGGAVALFNTAFATPDVPEATLTLGGTLLNAKPLRPFVETEAFSLEGDTLWATVTSKPDTVFIEAGAEVNSVVYNDVRVLELDARASGILDRDRVLTVGTLRTELSRFSIPTLAVRYSEFEADYTNDTLTFSADLTVDGRRDARLRGRAELGEENQRVVLETLDMNLDDDRWRLDQEATITYGDQYRVNNVLLVEDDQEILLDGVIDLNGRQSLGLTIYNFRIGSVADLFKFPDLDGTLNGDLFLSGPAEAPLVTGSLGLDVESFEEPVGRLNVGIDYADLRLDVDASIAHQDSSTMTLKGYLPLDLRLSAGDDLSEGPPIRVAGQLADPESDVSLAFEADRFNVGWVDPFLDPVTVNKVEGRLTAQVDVSGTLNNPVLIGAAMFDDGRLGLPLLGITLTDVSAKTVLARDTVYVESINVTSGKGTFRGSGTIDLPRLTLGAFDIQGNVDDFRVIDTRPYVADISADLRLRGTTETPLLTGTVKLVNTDIRPTEESTDTEFGPVEFTEADVRMLERYFNIRVTAADTTTFVLYDALAMDLNVDIEQDVWLRSRKNPEMNILLSGSLDLKKAPYEEQQLTGTVQVIPERSYIRQFGRRFDIRNGRVTFTGPATDPLLDFQAAYAIPTQNNQDEAITIIMNVDGSLQDKDGLTLELRSEPVTLDQADIISYIATGRPAAEAFQLSGGGTLEVGTDLALNQLTNLIASAAGAELGLDIVEIQQEGSRGATVTAGKYISRRLFASVSWPISFNSGASSPTSTGTDSNKEVIIEYEVFKWLLVRLNSDTSTIGLSLLYQYAY